MVVPSPSIIIQKLITCFVSIVKRGSRSTRPLHARSLGGAAFAAAGGDDDGQFVPAAAKPQGQSPGRPCGAAGLAMTDGGAG